MVANILRVLVIASRRRARCAAERRLDFAAPGRPDPNSIHMLRIPSFVALFASAALAACTAAAEKSSETPSGSSAAQGDSTVVHVASAAPQAENAPSGFADRRAHRGAVTRESGGEIDRLTSPTVRALYVNRWASQSRGKMRKFVAIADSTEINALVIDMKDEFGLNFKTVNASFAKNAGTASVVGNLAALLDTLKAHHILAIARIVVFKDSVTARVHPEWTIRRADNSVWRDHKGIAWVNPYHHELWDYNIGIAEELVKLGFEEIQWDYIRFPEPYASLPKQIFPGADNVSKPQALSEYLKEARRRLNKMGVRSTADIFGLVTTVNGPLEVGQLWEKISPQVDVVLPMVYPSHYPRGELGIPHPNADPYRVVNIALTGARDRDKKLEIGSPTHVRPWLQAFTLGKPEYGAEEIAAQKKAVYDAGYNSWVLWNPGSKYDVFISALKRETGKTAP
jgi:hypothetical protein